MKKIIYSIFIFAATVVACTAPQKTADYEVIPLPVSVQRAGDTFFVLEDGAVISYPEENEKMAKNAQFLVSYAKESAGLDLKAGGPSGQITLELGLDSSNKEAYELTVSDKGVVIRGASEAGVFYGIQTLRKSLPLMDRGTVFLPAVKISDEPRFRYRGMMLDVSRHFFSVEEVKTYIDMLALHNINRLHWHLTDDQGWRIEIKRYPKLTEIGSKRAQTVIGRNSGEYDGIPYGGFYTQEQIREVVAYAAERYITIVPEVDMPGHMQAVLACYPELGCTGGPYKVREKWGISSDVLCAGNDKTLQFVKDVLEEVVGLFPSEYVHIGGDECLKDEWMRCPKCQNRIRQLGLANDAQHTKEQKLQSWFVADIEHFLEEHGRRLIGWDEILEGDLVAPNATVMAWRDLRYGMTAARLHHDAIMTPSSHVYFDHYQDLDQNEPLAIGGYSSVGRVYNYEPIPSDLEPELRHHILGVQANLWTEYIPTFSHAQYMVLPRMDALCEVQWTPAGTKDYGAFCNRLNKMLHFYDKLGWNYAKHIYKVSADFALDQEMEGIKVSLNTVKGGEIYYTLDGSEPTIKSLRYTAPFVVQDKVVVKAMAVHDGIPQTVMSENLSYDNKISGIELLQEPHRSYRFNGASTLVDGLTGMQNYRTGRWLGFCGKDLEAIIKLKSETEISKVGFNTCVATSDWVFDVRQAIIEVSEDGIHFKKVAEESYPAMTSNDAYVKHYDLLFETVKAQYVKVTLVSEHSIPAFHGGKDHPGFIFVDEISID